MVYGRRQDGPSARREPVPGDRIGIRPQGARRSPGPPRMLSPTSVIDVSGSHLRSLRGEDGEDGEGLVPPPSLPPTIPDGVADQQRPPSAHSAFSQRRLDQTRWLLCARRRRPWSRRRRPRGRRAGRGSRSTSSFSRLAELARTSAKPLPVPPRSASNSRGAPEFGFTSSIISGRRPRPRGRGSPRPAPPPPPRRSAPRPAVTADTHVTVGVPGLHGVPVGAETPAARRARAVVIRCRRGCRRCRG